MAILVSLKADGSEGAYALSAVMMRNISISHLLDSEACSALDRAVYEWMAGTLSKDEGWGHTARQAQPVSPLTMGNITCVPWMLGACMQEVDAVTSNKGAGCSAAATLWHSFSGRYTATGRS
jgi:hypothetical protein